MSDTDHAKFIHKESDRVVPMTKYTKKLFRMMFCECCVVSNSLKNSNKKTMWQHER